VRRGAGIEDPLHSLQDEGRLLRAPDSSGFEPLELSLDLVRDQRCSPCAAQAAAYARLGRRVVTVAPTDPAYVAPVEKGSGVA
jgi:hypothetical protein